MNQHLKTLQDVFIFSYNSWLKYVIMRMKQGGFVQSVTDHILKYSI